MIHPTTTVHPSGTVHDSGVLAHENLPAVVALSGLHKAYENFVAVQDFSLEVKKGELLCLLGPSGCGKTTTLRMIAGFITPTSGSIRIADEDVSQLPPYRRDTGMVFQSYALFPHMTVAQNVAFGLANIGMSSARQRARVGEMLDLVELSHLAKRYPRELSGGQQQRVALARALALQPAVLLLDEPFSNLDAQLRVRLRQELRKLIDQVKITTLFVTHDQEEALMLADRIVVMQQGKIEQIGTPREIYEQPATRFVADFIGWCAILDGAVRNGVFVSHGGLHIPVQAGDQDRASLVLRPEHLHPSASGAAPERALQGVIETADYYGSMTRIGVRVGDELVLAEAGLEHGMHFEIGSTVTLSLAPHGGTVIPGGQA